MNELTTKRYYVEIVSYEDESVIERRGPFAPRRADKIDDGLNINLNHERYFTRIMDEDEIAFSGSKVLGAREP